MISLQFGTMAMRMNPQQQRQGEGGPGQQQQASYQQYPQQQHLVRLENPKSAIAEQQKQQIVTRDIKDTAQRISQVMAELQKSHDQKQAELQVVSVKLQESSRIVTKQKQQILEMQVLL